MQTDHLKQPILFMALLVLICLSVALPHGVGTAANTPQDGWPVSPPEQQGMQSETLVTMMAHIQEMRLDIDSITIIRNGNLVLDAYFFPFKKDATHIIHSCTKSITSAAFGIAVDKGYINDLDQRVYTLFPEKHFLDLNEQKKAITLRSSACVVC